MQPRRRASAVLVVSAVLAGCTVVPAPDPPSSTSPTPEPSVPASPRPPAALAPTLALPTDPVTVLPAGDPAELALATSTALYRSAPVVVVVADDAQRGRAASAAVALGAPLLLVDPAETGPVRRELARLGSEAVLVFGAADLGSPGRRVVTAPDDDAALAALLDRPFTDTAEVEEKSLTLAVAGLERDAPVLLGMPSTEGTDEDPAGEADEPDDPGPGAEASATESSVADPEPGSAASSVRRWSVPEVTLPPPPLTERRLFPPTDLPRTAHAPAANHAVVLTSGAPDEAVAVATARAAGATVLRVLAGDPRRDPQVVTALAEAAPDVVLALGPSFGTAEELAWKVDTARTGVELPGGGQVLFPGRRLVALYGHPAGGALGVLGEQDLEQTVDRAREKASRFDELTEDTVVPTFEIIATIASAEAGEDGDYSRETPVPELLPYVEAAAEAGIYVVLDLQPGRTDFLTQAKRYEELLRYPHVGLALDPEWRLKPDQRHLRQIGSVDVAEVNATLTWLADLTREHRLPQKLLVLHQFQLRMITGREHLDTSRDELAILIHADGQGSQPAKQDTWRALRRDAPEGVFWGWKNFYDEDAPMLTPRQTFEQVDPVPEFVSYQ